MPIETPGSFFLPLFIVALVMTMVSVAVTVLIRRDLATPPPDPRAGPTPTQLLALARHRQVTALADATRHIGSRASLALRIVFPVDIVLGLLSLSQFGTEKFTHSQLNLMHLITFVAVSTATWLGSQVKRAWRREITLRQALRRSDEWLAEAETAKHPAGYYRKALHELDDALARVENGEEHALGHTQ